MPRANRPVRANELTLSEAQISNSLIVHGSWFSSRLAGGFFDERLEPRHRAHWVQVWIVQKPG